MLRPRRASDVRSLFGATPEQIRQKQYEDQMAFLQSQKSGFGKAGAALGMGIAQLFGAPNKKVQEAEQRQEAVKGIDELGAMAEAEAAQRGMAPLSMTEPDVLAREANRLESVSAAFRNLGQDTGELDNEVLRLRVEADKAKRARELDDLRMRNQELQIERSEFDLTTAKEDRPLLRKSNQLKFEILGLNKQVAEGKIKNAEEQKEKLERVRKNTVSFFEGIDGAEQYVELVKGEILEPSDAISAWQESLKNKSLDLTEIGPYTINGVEVVGAYDKNTNTFVQYTDNGWLTVPATGLQQGPSSEGQDSTRIKGGRSVAKGSPQFKAYDRVLDTLVDTGVFDLEGEDVEKVSDRLGVDLDSTIGKEELFRLAEIEYNRQLDEGNIVTEAQVLRSILSGQVSPSAPETKDNNKPNLGAVSSTKKQ